MEGNKAKKKRKKKAAEGDGERGSAVTLYSEECSRTAQACTRYARSMMVLVSLVSLIETEEHKKRL